MNLSGHIEEQAKTVNRNPSDGQKEAGNYRKGHVKVHGLEISIENPRGSWRTGGPAGNKWRSRLPHHYGYIRRTEGADGDHVDVYLGPHLKAPNVFVIDQHNLHGGKSFDEHKCMIGFGSKKQAVEAYHLAFSDGKGKDRIGHVAAMTIDGFKDWLKNSDTTQAVKGFASGGAVQHMADGGAPVTDPGLLSQLNAPTPVTDPKILEQLNAPDSGGMNALASGAAQGATFGFSDELRGLNEAGGAKPNEPASLGQTIKGAYRYFTGDKEAEQRYDEAVKRERAADETAKAQHPYLHMAGELAGSIPAMAMLPGAGVAADASLATKAVKGAQVGAEYGGLSGLGEGKDTGERALDAATGIVSGIVGGAGGSLVGSGLGAVSDRYIAPLAKHIFGSTEGGAAEKLASALKIDQDLISKGKAQGMPLNDWIAAKQAGEPVTFADLGSTTTQALLRSAANTSPEGRAMMETTFGDRFAGQTERVSNEVRGLVAGGANAGKTGDQLVAEYDLARAPAYKRAYAQGDKEIVSPTIERLMGSPMFESAMKSAVTSGKDRAITEGLGAFNPGVAVENGLIKFTKTNPQGVPQYPNLQYWDAVKKELDGIASMGKRSGDPRGDVAASMAKTLRGELDKQVPSYADARGVASQYFGESNALEAGQKLAGKRVDPAEISRVMRQMKPDEQELFREGYASGWANRVIGNMSDSRDITKAMFNSPNERARALAVFGQAGLDKMQTRMTLETIMDGARKAMGNSTTARQLIEAGLAGGIGGLGAYEGDKYGGPWGGVAGALVASGAGHAGVKAVQIGGKKLIGAINGNLARSVAELLTSSDPAKLQQGLRMAQKNKAIGDGLKNIANRVSLAGQQQVAPSITRSVVRPLQGPMPVGASDEKQKPVGVRNQ